MGMVPKTKGVKHSKNKPVAGLPKLEFIHKRLQSPSSLVNPEAMPLEVLDMIVGNINILDLPNFLEASTISNVNFPGKEKLTTC